MAVAGIELAFIALAKGAAPEVLLGCGQDFIFSTDATVLTPDGVRLKHSAAKMSLPDR